MRKRWDDVDGAPVAVPAPETAPKSTHLMARYMGRMAKSGKVWTLIMMVMKAM